MKTCPSCGYKNDDSLKFCGECGSRLEVGKDPFIGTTIDRRYEVIEKIAEGGMGSVYRARNVRLKKDIAIKILHPELARDKKLLKRFENEAVTVAGLRHDNIVQVHDTGPVRDTYYIAMDYVEGSDLVEIIEKKGPFSVDEAFSIAAQVAEGLAYAHERGILHRDIKPSNIIVDKTGKVVITDFGIAKALGEKGQTTTGTSIGTPEYMSYEQIKGMELDGRTDIYSLGVVLYEMLTGKSPFHADTGISAIAKILSEDAVPAEGLRSDLPDWAVTVISKIMSKKREDRYQSAREFLKDINVGVGKEHLIREYPREIRETTSEKKVIPKRIEITRLISKNKKKALIIATISALIIIGSIVVGISFYNQFKNMSSETSGGLGEEPFMGFTPVAAVNWPKLLIATDALYPPFEMIDSETGVIVGFDIDLMNEIAKEGGFEVEYINTPWDGIFVGLDNGNYDAIISAVSITDERKLSYDFSVPYYSITQALIVRKDMATWINTIDDLRDRKVGAQIGTTGAIFVSRQEMVKLVNYDDNALAIEALIRGDISGVVCDHPVAYNYALVNPAYKDRLEVVDDDIQEGTYELYGVVVKKGNTEVLEIINKGISGVSNMTRDEIARKWKMKK